MLSWLDGDSRRARNSKGFADVTEGFQQLYREKLLPVELEHDFHSFHSPALTDADFSARPMVLLLGQYSSGKTSLAKHLVGQEYPGSCIGPEPTTDKFVAIVHGDAEQVIPGNALVMDNSMPFTQLSQFGNTFLQWFQCARLKCPRLEGITLIDTPGVLAGETQRLKREYDFESVVTWFADRVDMILILFDVAKLDISDEFRRVILAVKSNSHKIHFILNKADRCATPDLMRVYGAMMWNLGKVIDTPEVCRVHIGSFWDEALKPGELLSFFESEAKDLKAQLAELPHNAHVRRFNDLIKRAKLAKVHAYLMDHLKRKMPVVRGKEEKQKELIANLAQVYEEIAKERKGIALGDFPNARMMQEKLATKNFCNFKKIDERRMQELENMLNTEVPKLWEMIEREARQLREAGASQVGSQASPAADVNAGGTADSTSCAKRRRV